MDITRIHSEMISGLDSDELSFVELLTHTNMNDIDQFTGLPFETTRSNENNISTADFPELNENILSEIDSLEKEAMNKSTDSQTKHYIGKFKGFLRENTLPDSIETMPERFLGSYLRFWYSKMRKSDGSMFAPSTMICARAAVQRYMENVGRNVNIIDGEHFKQANKTIKSIIALKLKEKASISQNTFEALENDDLLKLKKYFSRDDPVRLQHEIFFLIIFHFGFRGREWLRDINKADLMFCSDSNGKEFIDLKIEKREKNVKGSLSRRHYETNKNAVIYSMDEKNNCPVSAIRYYLSKIPPSVSVLFPKPKKNHSDGYWYCEKQVVGKHTLYDMMKNISKAAQLSRIYTNHCVRSTVVTLLSNEGFKVDEIKSVTGHKRTESLERYNKRMRLEKKKELSNVLSESLINEQIQCAEKTNKNIVINDNCISISESTQSMTTKSPTLLLEKDNCKISVFL